VALLVPISGWVAERFGVKKVFIVAVFIFTLGSLLCAFSPGLKFLIFSRVVQGLGGALMMPVGRLAAISAYPKNEMVRVLSFITIPALVGPILGPVIGGIIVQYFHWSWVFLINVPIGIICVIATYFTMQSGGQLGKSKFDWRGFTLFSIAIASITLGLESFDSPDAFWTTPGMLFAIGGIFLLLYTQFAFSHPFTALFGVRMFFKKSFSIGILTNVVSRIGSGAFPFITPLLMQTAMGYSPLKTGLTMLPAGIASIIAKTTIDPILNRMGYRRFLTLNTILLGLLLAAFAFIGNDTPYWFFIVLLMVFSTINSMQFTAMNALTLIDLPVRDMGDGNSLLSVIMQISMSVGIAAATAFLAWFGGDNAAQGSPEIMRAFQLTYICLGATALLSSLIYITPLSRGIVSKPSAQK
jgi:EmrB/QacA subfamily drug resistance transporter